MKFFFLHANRAILPVSMKHLRVSIINKMHVKSMVGNLLKNLASIPQVIFFETCTTRRALKELKNTCLYFTLSNTAPKFRKRREKEEEGERRGGRVKSWENEEEE